MFVDKSVFMSSLDVYAPHVSTEANCLLNSSCFEIGQALQNADQNLVLKTCFEMFQISLGYVVSSRFYIKGHIIRSSAWPSFSA